MKHIKIILPLSLALISGLTSCLKKSVMNIDPENGAVALVELGNTGDNLAATTSTYPGYYCDLGVLANGNSTTFNVNLNYSDANVTSEDITVAIGIDNDLLSLYNNQNGTNYVMPPSSIFTLPSSGVIKKGSKLCQVQVKITRNSDFIVGTNYALPIKIISTTKGSLSSNFGKSLYSFGVRNKYDGHYRLDQSSVLVDVLVPGNSSSDAAGPYPYEFDLVTIGANSVKMHTADGDLHYIANGSSYGEFDPVFTFDGGTNVVSVTNLFGQPSPSRKRSAELDPSGVNAVSSNKNIDVKYFLNQSGKLKATFDEHFKYIGPR